MQKDQEKILGVKIHKFTFKQTSELIFKWLKTDKQNYITTPNPEIILSAQKHDKFLRILNQSNLNTADGIGLLWAAKFLNITKNTKAKTLIFIKFTYSYIATLVYPKYIKTIIPERVAGSDLMLEICKKSQKDKYKIFLLGALPGIAEKTKQKLEKKFKKINIVGTYSGKGELSDDKITTNLINTSKAEIVFVAYGAPKQEKWIYRNLKKMPTVKLAVGIGGTFDFISGTKKRAPKWMKKTGLEWLYRLIKEPKRIKRIANATVIFPLTILKKKLKQN